MPLIKLLELLLNDFDPEGRLDPNQVYDLFRSAGASDPVPRWVCNRIVGCAGVIQEWVKR